MNTVETLLDPRAEQYRQYEAPGDLRAVDVSKLNVAVLDSRWASMEKIAEMLDERFQALPEVADVGHVKIKHGEPTPQDVLDHVTSWSHFAVLGLGN